MDAALESILDSLELGSFKEKLQELGLVACGDVGFLLDADLKQAGLTLVQTRKLQARVRQDQELQKQQAQDAEAARSSRKRPAEVQGEPRGKRPCDLARTSLSLCQGRGSPRRLIFIRHGESEANVNRKITVTVPDHNLHLTQRGRQQAINAGERLKEVVGDGSLRFTYSPYVRARETLHGILRAWDRQWPCYEDVRIREQEFGNYDSPDMKALHKEKAEFGPFFYRFREGESPADCYDRASSFLESLFRSFQGETVENHAIVGHGTMLVVLLMRLLQLNISDFECFEGLQNCELVVCERQEDGRFAISYTWAPAEEKNFGGLRRSDSVRREVEIWDGDPSSRMLSHDPSASDSSGDS